MTSVSKKVKLEDIDRILKEERTEELLGWSKYIIPYFTMRPIIIKEGEGAILRDTTGKEYIDFASIAHSCILGYNNEKIKEAMKKQIDELSTITGTHGYNIPALKLGKLLAEIAPGDLSRYYLATGGSEVVDIAIKTVRAITGKSKIISRWGGYHGNLAWSGTASGTVLYKRAYDPVAPGFIHVPPPYCYRCAFGLEYPECGVACAKVIEDIMKYEGNAVAAVIGEPIIGGGGVVIPPDEYWPIVRKVCDEYGVILIDDEIITSFGRTGKMFACEHWGIIPDVMTVSKTLGACYNPIAAILTTEKISKSVEDLKCYHFNTYCYHPVSCAAAMATIRVIIEEKLVERSARMGEYALKGLISIVEEFDVLDDARGRGLYLGFEIVKSKKTKEPDPELGMRICEEAFKDGLFFLVSRLRMKDAVIGTFCPPLVTTEEQIDKALEIFRSAVKKSI